MIENYVITSSNWAEIISQISIHFSERLERIKVTIVLKLILMRMVFIVKRNKKSKKH